jgi:hypothetical protein
VSGLDKKCLKDVLILGTYGRTTAETEADENKHASVSVKKPKKEEKDDYSD